MPKARKLFFLDNILLIFCAVALSVQAHGLVLNYFNKMHFTGVFMIQSAGQVGEITKTIAGVSALSILNGIMLVLSNSGMRLGKKSTPMMKEKSSSSALVCWLIIVVVGITSGTAIYFRWSKQLNLLQEERTESYLFPFSRGHLEKRIENNLLDTIPSYNNRTVATDWWPHFQVIFLATFKEDL